jgi:hypothetical protein
MSSIRDVGRWLQVHGHSDAYVLSDRGKAQVLPAHPSLLSRYEIEAFFAAAATLNADSPWRWQAVAFTLRHSCGLRTGETRLPRPEHMHLPDRNLDIVSSTGNRSRRLPLTGEVTEVLAGCDRVSATRVRPIAAHVLRLRDRQPGHRRDPREDVPPDLGPGQSPATGRRSAAAAVRLPALGGRRGYAPCRCVCAGGDRAGSVFVRIILGVGVTGPASRASRSGTAWAGSRRC